MAKTHALLEAEGKPMHVGDILKGIQVSDNSEHRRQLRQQLNSYARNKDTFTRLASATFGLTDWESIPPAGNGADPQQTHS